MMRIFMIVSFISMCASASSQIRFTYHWRQIDGVVETIIETPDRANTIVTGLNVPGEYFYEFSICNDFGCGLDTARVTVLPEKALALDTTTVIRPPRVRRFEVSAIKKGGEVLVQIKSPTRQKVKIVLFNQLGQPLAQSIVSVKPGYNFASLPAPVAHGIYYLRVFTDYFNQTHKILI